MSIQIQRDGRKIYDDDLGVQLSLSSTVSVRDLIDHLELVAQVPNAYGMTTSSAARGALNLITVLAEGAGLADELEDLGISCLPRPL